MEFLQEFVLALIQAILEWLPVSSEGFLILTAVNLFGETAEAAFRIAIYFHLGTAIAVLIKYRKTYLDALLKDRTLLRFLVLTTLATGIVGVPLYLLLRDTFDLLDGMLVTLLIGATLAVTGALLRWGKLKSSETLAMEDRKPGDEFSLGVAQGFAILPGISRSGVTMTYLVLRGFKREDAFKMSFIVSLPAVLAAIAFDLLIEGVELALDASYFLLMGIVTVVGYLMMDLLLRLAKRVSFDVICFLLSVVTIGLVVVYYVWS